MESAQTPGGPSRALPRATPAGATRGPSRPVPSQPTPFTSTAPREAVQTGPSRAREAQPQAICRWRHCDQPTEKGFVFCPTHEADWHNDKTSHEPESTERQFVRSVYNRPEDEKLPYKPASHEPKPRTTKGYEQPPINRVLAALNTAGCAYRASTTSPDSWQAQCPTHQDSRPSLLIRRNGDGMVWLKCWAGCSKESILHALGLSWGDLWESCHHDPDRRNARFEPLLAPHLRRAMLDLLKLDDERRAAA